MVQPKASVMRTVPRFAQSSVVLSPHGLQACATKTKRPRLPGAFLA